MTRFSAAATISICWILFTPNLATAQSDQATVPSCHAGELLKDGVCVPDEGKCFPWPEFREGNCVTKSTPEPSDSTPPAIPTRCAGGTIDASGQCACPADTHLDGESGNCLADPKPVRKASDTVVCDGGTLTDGKCACPGGYDLMPANGTMAASGTCVKTDAANCQGGELTVAGTCFCNGRVTMSGENYALELVGGKCVPKRCPEHSYLKDGKCVASGDSNFAFTCRTGYIPDEANPGTAGSGLHCLPDPTFCDASVKRRNGSCPKSSAVAIDCFEAKCVCRDPHADWVNYLCQCAEPYRNANGACVSDAADHGGPAREQAGSVDKPGEPPDEQASPRRSCGRGMIRSHGTCVAARRRYRAGVFEQGAPGPGYPGEYYLRGGPRLDRFRDYPIAQRDNYNSARRPRLSAALRAAPHPAANGELQSFRCNR